MITFILFPGNHQSKKSWVSYYDNDNKEIIDDFLAPLKKLGNVFTYTPKQYNVLYYSSGPNVKSIYEPDIDFDLDYLDVGRHIDIIYKEVKSQYPAPYVPIGHSIGLHFALGFTQKYKSECLFTVSLDGSFFVEKYINFYIEERLAQHKDTKIENNDELQKLLHYIKTHEDNKKEIEKILGFFTYKDFLWAKEHLSEKLVLPLITFKNINLPTNEEKQKSSIEYDLKRVDEQKILDKINGPKSITRYFVNATHFVWEQLDYRNEIISTIEHIISDTMKTDNEDHQKYMKYKRKYLECKQKL